jgi:flavin-dependent dehydrogenase
MTRWDVIVAGGGPAGAVCAIELARAGRRVALFDACRFPHDAVGESLSPTACAVLESAGVRFAEAGFVAKRGATFVWGQRGTFRTTYAGATAWQVRRAELDATLLKLAADTGVAVHHRQRVDRVRFAGDRAVGVRVVDEAGGARDLDCAWVVDATGRAALLARQLGLLEDDTALCGHAVWARWKGGRRLPSDSVGDSLFVGSDATAWWYVPIDDRDDLVSVGMTSPTPVPDTAAADMLERSVARAPVVGELLRDARRVGPARVVSIAARCSRRLTGPGWLLVGDAAGFVDPIVTPGVQLAVESGQSAARAIEAVGNARPDSSAELRSYERRLRHQHRTYRWLATNLYGVARAPAATTTAVPAAGEQADRLTFLSVISGIPQRRLLALLGDYLPMRAGAVRYGGKPAVFGETEGFAFLTWVADGPVAEPTHGNVRESRLRLAPQVAVEDIPSPVGAQTVRAADGQGFLLTDELRTVVRLLSRERDYADLARCFTAAYASEPDPQTFDRWLGLLVRYGLVECRPLPATAGATATTGSGNG